jgi:hypothetical protein
MSDSKIEILILIVIVASILIYDKNQSLNNAEHDLEEAYQCAEIGRAKNKKDLFDCLSDDRASRGLN